MYNPVFNLHHTLSNLNIFSMKSSKSGYLQFDFCSSLQATISLFISSTSFPSHVMLLILLPWPCSYNPCLALFKTSLSPPSPSPRHSSTDLPALPSRSSNQPPVLSSPGPPPPRSNDPWLSPPYLLALSWLPVAGAPASVPRCWLR